MIASIRRPIRAASMKSTTPSVMRGLCGDLHVVYEAQRESAEGIQTEGDQGEMGGREGYLRDS